MFFTFNALRVIITRKKMFNSEKEMKMFAPVRNTNSKVFLNLSHAPSKEAKKITRIAEKESKRVRDMRKPSKGRVVTYIA